MSQTARFHRALEKAGRQGITRLDFERDPVIDGGPPILRAARCADDLKRRGIDIVSDPHGGPGRCAIYWLREHAPTGAIRHNNKPDLAPATTQAPDTTGYRQIVLCHGCLSTHAHPFQCPNGRRLELMLAPADQALTTACTRHQHINEERHAA